MFSGQSILQRMFVAALMPLLAGLFLVPSIPRIVNAQALTTTEQRCVVRANKHLRKLRGAVGKALRSCHRYHARGGLVGKTIQECTYLDQSGRIGKIEDRIVDDETRYCTKAPPFGHANAATTIIEAKVLSLGILKKVTGEDLDAVLKTEGQDSAVERCQQDVARKIRRCEYRTLATFNGCKKDGLRNGTILDAADLALCLGADPKGKVARECDPYLGSIRNELDRSCVSRGVDLNQAFPSCGSNDPEEVATCIEFAVRCGSCLALDAVDSLDLDCDANDDGLSNGSCMRRPPTATCEMGFGSSVRFGFRSGLLEVEGPLTGVLEVDCTDIDPVTGEARCSCSIPEPIESETLELQAGLDFSIRIDSAKTSCGGDAVLACHGGAPLDMGYVSEEVGESCTNDAGCTESCETACASRGLPVGKSDCAFGFVCECHCYGVETQGIPSRPGATLCYADVSIQFANALVPDVFPCVPITTEAALHPQVVLQGSPAICDASGQSVDLEDGEFVSILDRDPSSLLDPVEVRLVCQ